MNKKMLGALLSVVLVPAVLAVGVADVDIVAGADNGVATWDAIKALMIPIGVFTVGYGFFKRLRRA